MARELRQLAWRAEHELVMFTRHAAYVANGAGLYIGSIVHKYEVNSRNFQDYELANVAWATALLLRWFATGGRTARILTASWLFAMVVGIELLHNDLTFSRLFHRTEREFKVTQIALIALDAISVTLVGLYLLLRSSVIASVVNCTALLIASMLMASAEAYQLDIDQVERAEQDRNGAYRALMQQLQAFEELPGYELLSRLDAFVEHRGTPPEVVKRLPTYTKAEKTTTDGDCMICFAEYEQGDEIKVLPCFHKAHKDCLEEWLKDNIVCPMCQVNVDREETDFDE